MSGAIAKVLLRGRIVALEV